MDWHAWHDMYEQADHALARRLRVVQERIRAALDSAPPGPLRVVSVCAGQGRDLSGALDGHPRRADVTALLVEADPRNAAAARVRAAEAGVRADVVEGDAAWTGHYTAMAPADLLVLCGLFGNITATDIERTLDHCRRLLREDGTLVWTCPLELTTRVCGMLEQRGFARRWLSGEDVAFGVGAHRHAGPCEPLEPDARMFTFVGYDVLQGRY